MQPIFLGMDPYLEAAGTWLGFEPDPDVALDLGAVFRRAYETGPYRKVLAYREPPDPALRPEDLARSRELIEPALAKG